MFKNKKGFTLIELLVVIAVLGVLAAVVIVAINPLQQLAKSRDAGRLNSVDQIGQALVTYAESNNNNYPTVAQWNAGTPASNILITSGELSSVPSAVTYAGAVTACTTAVTNGTWCYKTAAATGPAIVYAKVEALSNSAKCAANQTGWFVYSTADGRSGVVCTASEAALAAGAQTFVP